MPEATRLGDMAANPADKHGCPIEPHPTIGPAVQGSGNVLPGYFMGKLVKIANL